MTAVFATEASLLARMTVYWRGEGQGRASSNGARLRNGHCAVDPKQIPYGSRVVLPDGSSLSAVDTGSAVRNRKAARRSGRNLNERNAIVIDKFFETKQQALAWANSNPPFVNVKVISPRTPTFAKPSLLNNQPIALTPSQHANRPTRIASAGVMTIARNAPATGPTGGIVRNPLGRLGR